MNRLLFGKIFPRFLDCAAHPFAFCKKSILALKIYKSTPNKINKNPRGRPLLPLTFLIQKYEFDMNIFDATLRCHGDALLPSSWGQNDSWLGDELLKPERRFRPRIWWPLIGPFVGLTESVVTILDRSDLTQHVMSLSGERALPSRTLSSYRSFLSSRGKRTPLS